MQYRNERGKPIPHLESLSEVAGFLKKMYPKTPGGFRVGSRGMSTIRRAPFLTRHWEDRAFDDHREHVVWYMLGGTRFDDEKQALYYWHLEHEALCPHDMEIKIPTYPGSERKAAIHVCSDCRHFYEATP